MRITIEKPSMIYSEETLSVGDEFHGEVQQGGWAALLHWAGMASSLWSLRSKALSPLAAGCRHAPSSRRLGRPARRAGPCHTGTIPMDF